MPSRARARSPTRLATSPWMNAALTREPSPAFPTDARAAAASPGCGRRTRRQEQVDRVGADEAGAAGDEHARHQKLTSPWRPRSRRRRASPQPSVAAAPSRTWRSGRNRTARHQEPAAAGTHDLPAQSPGLPRPSYERDRSAGWRSGSDRRFFVLPVLVHQGAELDSGSPRSSASRVSAGRARFVAWRLRQDVVRRPRSVPARWASQDRSAPRLAR